MDGKLDIVLSSRSEFLKFALYLSANFDFYKDVEWDGRLSFANPPLITIAFGLRRCQYRNRQTAMSDGAQTVRGMEYSV